MNWLPLVAAVPTSIIATLAVIGYFYNRKKDKNDERARLFHLIEQSFDVLQRLNESALQSGRHARLGMMSVNRNENPPEDEALIIYFHYLRLNRVFRIYEFHRHGFISDGEFTRIFDCFKGTLLDAMPIIDELAPRGYPADFVDFLKKNVSEADRAPLLSALKSDN